MKSVFRYCFWSFWFLIVALTDALTHKNLNYFETLHADDVTHNTIKKGSEKSVHKYNKIEEIAFKTLGKGFRIILSPRQEILHSNFKASAIDGHGKETVFHLDHEKFYEGRVFGELDSYASIHIDNGVITGAIHLPDEIYHLEPSWRHFSHFDNRTMIAYKASDVKLSHWNHLDGNATSCGYIQEDSEWDEPETQNGSITTDGIKLEEIQSSKQKTRRKRAVEEYEIKKSKCPLLLVADYRFYQAIGGGDVKTTINYLVSLIDRVDKLYSNTLWTDGEDGIGFKGMGFLIKKIIVHTEPTAVYRDTHYNMEMNGWDVRSLLEEFSRQKINKDYCLSHLFTHQTFRAKTSSVLGLAYIASARSRSHGGICSEEYRKNGRWLYLNSGLSSSRNHYGQRVITREADLVTSHEFGHNWGSEHDPDMPECAPNSKHGGSYLMYTYSVSGYDVNNKKFSPCSIRSIAKVLQAKSSRCFIEPQKSFCGNLRVEDDEECDAGLFGTEDNDTCCDNNCKLRRGAVCSDKNSPCCQNCQYMSPGVVCREAQLTSCEREARCTGLYEGCPRSLPVPDGTECLERGKCQNGVCVPFCETQRLQSCMCDTMEHTCKRCCRKSMNNTCYPVDINDILPDGTPCMQGFCSKGVCEKVIQDFVERFWNIIEDISINKVLLFLKDNIVGSVIVISTIIWIPTSCVISYFDKKRLEECRKWEWRISSRDFVPPGDHIRIVNVPRQECQPRDVRRPTKRAIPE